MGARLRDVPADQAGAARAFWSALTGRPVRPSWAGHLEFVSLEPPEGSSHLHVQVVDGPPRVHLDLLGDPPALEALGATRGHRGDGWRVMASPTGLPFCVTADDPGR